VKKLLDVLNRTDCIRDEWEKYIEGKPVNKEKVSDQIYYSWKKSSDYGIDPFAYPSDWKTASLTLTNNKVFLNLNSIMEQIRYFCDQNDYRIELYDKEARLIIDFSGKRLEAINVAEHVAGTNSVCFALKSNEPEIVMGYEHFISLAHVYYCLAVPFHNRNGETIGAVVIVCQERKQLNSLALSFAMFCAQMCTVCFSYFHDENEFRIDDKGLNRIIKNIPQGLVYIDYRNVMTYYNQKALEILNISKDQNQKTELKKYVSNGLPKSLLVTTKEIEGKSKQQRDRLIIIEDPDWISKLYEFKKTPREINSTSAFDKIIGKNNKLLKAKHTAYKTAGTSYPVLIYGESGTGKELFAQAISDASLRNNQPFVPVNCGAIPSELVESVLFGYEPGAFTGALKNGKKGLMEVASGGTIFLDEIESMPMHVQISLLRALSEGKIQTVGGTKEKRIDVRVIAASKRNLLEEADSGRFREDLFYRLSTIIIDLPPLRERTDDIALLVQYFIDKINCKIDNKLITVKEDYIDPLRYYYWRGNIRELENVISRSILIMGESEKELTYNHLPENIQKAYIYKSTKERLASSEILKERTDNILDIGEEILIESTLTRYHNNLIKASLALGISRKTLYNKIHKNKNLYKKIKDTNISW